MKLWQKDYQVESIVEEFTVGEDRELDMRLIYYDILASRAHAQMLSSVGVLTSDEEKSIVVVLESMLVRLESGELSIEPEFEDMHSKIEHELIRQLGETGKKIHTGRSRNDQVLISLHLYILDTIDGIKEQTRELFDALIHLSEKHKDIIIPGYTHLQAAMPSSFGLWFGAYAESLVDDLYMLNAARKVADQNPLGSAAGYGSAFPLDRQMTTELLGLSTLKYNSVAAQMSRGKVEKVLAFAMASLAGTVSKLCADICLYTSQNFDFIGFPDELTTGSSIMPHKKNPDLFELTRAKCNKIQNLPAELIALTNNLPSGYHRDFQMLKGSVIHAVDALKDCLKIVTHGITQVEVKTNAKHDKKYDLIFTVESVNKLVNDGVSFRDAYGMVAKQVEKGNYKPEKNINHTHAGSIGNLCNEEIVSKFNEAFQL